MYGTRGIICVSAFHANDFDNDFYERTRFEENNVTTAVTIKL